MIKTSKKTVKKSLVYNPPPLSSAGRIKFCRVKIRPPGVGYMNGPLLSSKLGLKRFRDFDNVKNNGMLVGGFGLPPGKGAEGWVDDFW